MMVMAKRVIIIHGWGDFPTDAREPREMWMQKLKCDLIEKGFTVSAPIMQQKDTQSL